MNGNLTITMAINAIGKAKKVTLLREYYVSEKQACEIKQEFIRANHNFIDTDRIICMWQPVGKVI